MASRQPVHRSRLTIDRGKADPDRWPYTLALLSIMIEMLEAGSQTHRGHALPATRRLARRRTAPAHCGQHAPSRHLRRHRPGHLLASLSEGPGGLSPPPALTKPGPGHARIVE